MILAGLKLYLGFVIGAFLVGVISIASFIIILLFLGRK